MKTNSNNEVKNIIYTNNIFAVPDDEKAEAIRDYSDANDCTPEDVTDEDVLQWLYVNFDEVIAALNAATDNNTFILQSHAATFYPELYGRGVRVGYNYTNDLANVLRKLGDEVTLYTDAKGNLFCQYAHHDGCGTIQIKAVNSTGVRVFDAWNYGPEDGRTEYDVCNTIFSYNLFSRRPGFAWA